MSLGFPNTYAAIVEDKPMNQEWLRYFQRLHDLVGLSGAVFPLWSNEGVIDALLMTPDASTPPTLAAFVGSISRWGFDASTAQSLHAGVRLRSGYENGTMLRPYIEWAPSTISAGVVRWGIEATWSSVDSPATASTFYYIDSTASEVAGNHVLESLGSVDGDALLGPGSTVSIRVFRDAADPADTYPDTAFLIAAGFVASNNSTGTPEVKP
jgi:hypothetical protein